MTNDFTKLLDQAFRDAVKKAISETHDAGRPTTHGDQEGVYHLYPNGTKEYISLYGGGASTPGYYDREAEDTRRAISAIREVVASKRLRRIK